MQNHESELSQAPLVTTLRTAQGNASPEAKLYISKWYETKGVGKLYMYPILSNMEATEVDVSDIPEQPGKKKARVVFELDVREGAQVNEYGLKS
jgi:hypothetical protein